MNRTAHRTWILCRGCASGLLGESVNCRYDDTLRDAAYDVVQRAFWEKAANRAEPVLGDIFQDGRSGGWLVFSTDPTYGGDITPSREWLTEYRELREWAESFIAEAPERVARLAQQLAMDELGRGPARRMFATNVYLASLDR